MPKIRKFIFEQSYTISEGSRFLRDWEDFGPQNLPEYFSKGYQIFYQRLETFKALQRPLEAEEEQELTFMLEALIHAKNARYAK